MTKKQQAKLEDIEREIDSMKSKKTTNKRIKIMKEVGIESKKRGHDVLIAPTVRPFKEKVTTQPKKRGRPVGSKTKRTLTKEELAASMVDKATKNYWSGKISVDNGLNRDPETGEQVVYSEATVEQVKDWSRFKPQSGICLCEGGIPRGGEHSEDICFWGKLPETENQMSLPNKITWVLTVVNVAILISLVIKNV